MSVYVDQPIFPFGRMMMCHLWADSLDELLAMVDRIGVQRKWIQGHPTLSFGKHRDASWVHFDIAKGKRALAIQAGAIETDRYGASYFEAQRRGLSRRVEMIEDLRRRGGRPVTGFITPTPTPGGLSEGGAVMGAFPYSWAPPAVLMRTGECLVPTELSWRRADQLVKAGFASIDPHHQRWLGKLTLSASGRARAGLSPVNPPAKD